MLVALESIYLQIVVLTLGMVHILHFQSKINSDLVATQFGDMNRWSTDSSWYSRIIGVNYS